MLHLQRTPRRPVADFVEQLWLVHGSIPQAQRHMLLPDGALVVIFNLGAPQRLCERADVQRHAVFRASWVSGQQPQPIVIEQAGAYHLAAIRFCAGGAWPLLRFSVSELTGRVVELEDIWGREAARVREQLGEARDGAALLACLEAWLARRLRDAEPPEQRVEFAAKCLRRGGMGVGRIAAEVGWSHKHLADQFERRVGLAPKLFGRVQRLQRVVGLVGTRGGIDWADVAALGGFYDQAHLIREFRELIGLTPGEFLARRSGYPGYLNVA